MLTFLIGLILGGFGGVIVSVLMLVFLEEVNLPF